MSQREKNVNKSVMTTQNAMAFKSDTKLETFNANTHMLKKLKVQRKTDP